MGADRDNDAAGGGILPAEGADAFARILARPEPQVVVCTRDFNALVERSRPGRTGVATEPEGESETQDEPTGTLHGRPDLPQAYEAPRNELEEAMASVVGRLLGIEKVGVNDNLFELGFDSLLAHSMAGRLQESLGVRLPLRVMLEIPTVAQLAEIVQIARAAVEPAEKGSRAP